MGRSKPSRVAVVVLAMLASAALAAPLLTAHRFHPDEALFSWYGLQIQSGPDFLLAQQPVDKPPLLFYLLAGSFALIGRNELAGRLPALLAAPVDIALVYSLTRQWFRAAEDGNTAVLAALALALSPYHIAFSATAFTDPLVVTFTLAGLLCLSRGYWGRAGLFLGLAFATKIQAVLLWPLAGLLLWRERKHLPPHSPALLAALAALPAAVLLWDIVRARPRSLWAEAAASYGGLHLISLPDLPLRLLQWRDPVIYLFGSPLLAAAFAAGLVALFLLDWRSGNHSSCADAELDALLIAFMLGYLAFHILLSLQPWDRYLLSLAPFLAILIGRMLNMLPNSLMNQRRPAGMLSGERRPWLPCGLAAGALCLVLLPSAIAASSSHLPIGSDHGLYDGIDQVGAFLRTRPWGTVVYDHWLDWELRFYVRDALIVLNWQPSAESLAHDLNIFGGRSPRYLVVPGWKPGAEDIQAIQAAGFDIEPALETYRADGSLSMTVYEIHSRTPADE